MARIANVLNAFSKCTHTAELREVYLGFASSEVWDELFVKEADAVNGAYDKRWLELAM